ncbi:MAG: ATP-binding protein [Planctomycetota bacterium]
MISSIRWTIIGWFGLLLSVVLGTFGVLLYQQAAAATLQGVDAGLTNRADAIAAALEWDDREGWELELSDDYLGGLTARGYYRVWDPAGTPVSSGGAGGPDLPHGVAGFLTRDGLREIERAGPEGAMILVGTPIRAEIERLASLRLLVSTVGGIVLALGLCGGVFLARRSLAPVSSLASAAAAVNERNLATRLDESSAPSELKPLARSFNATLDRLQSAFLRQTRFTADASHELRTPVSVIRAQAEQALRNDRSPGEYRAALAACLRGAERMTGLVEGLLALSRADAGEERPALTPVDLAVVVRNATDLLRPEAVPAEVTLSCTTQPARVLGDSRLLAEVLSNLVHNGIRYNRPGGAVNVAVSQEDGSVMLVVSDTGIGIAKEELPHLFERFYRVDPARSRAHGGSGLGLSIAHWIVQAHGGAIEVESRPREGSTFSVRLPARRDS